MSISSVWIARRDGRTTALHLPSVKTVRFLDHPVHWLRKLRGLTFAMLFKSSLMPETRVKCEPIVQRDAELMNVCPAISSPLFVKASILQCMLTYAYRTYTVTIFLGLETATVDGAMP